MRYLICALIVSIGGAGAAVAQEIETRTTSHSRLTVERGKDVTVTGCVARSADNSFTLLDAAGKDGALGSYMLVADGSNADRLGEHVGHRVEIRGKAADQGDGRLRIQTRTEVETSSGDRRRRESRTEIRGDLEGLPFLSVRSVRMLASVCP